MSRIPVRVFTYGVLMASLLWPLGSAWAVERSAPQIWTSFRNAQFGFSFDYPSGLLVLDETAAKPAGQLFRSADGRVTLLAGAIVNDGGETVDSYRRFLLNETYSNAPLDYAPVRRSWFVLSGTKPGRGGDEIFYERVTFACDGRTIFGRQLTYPAVERRIYDAVVERIHRSYRPGRGGDSRC